VAGQRYACLSIVIINHNYGRFLRSAIDSALAQTVPAFDVVVVDDGSTDMSVQIIEEYGGRIRPVFKDKGGHVSAVNAGFAQCRGDIVIFLDADDYLYPSCGQAVLENWHDGASKLQFRLATVDGDGTDQNMPFPYFAGDLTPAVVRAQSFLFGVYPWTVSSGNAFSRSLLEKLFPIDARTIYRSPDGYINKMAPLFGAYRVHGANAWAQKRGALQPEAIIRWLKFDIVLQRNFLELAQEHGIDVNPAGNQLSLQHLEHRFIAWRFAPEETPYQEDDRAALFRFGYRAVQRSPNVGTVGKLVWAGWLFLILNWPKPVVVWLFSRLRPQLGRARISKVIIAVSRGMAKPPDRASVPVACPEELNSKEA
jgi:glycosyltransferase involved in cell wall biosynthesis